MPRRSQRSRSSESAQLFAQRVLDTRARVAPLVPEVSDEDLLLILQSLLRPIGSGRRFFLWPTESGLHVP